MNDDVILLIVGILCCIVWFFIGVGTADWWKMKFHNCKDHASIKSHNEKFFEFKCRICKLVWYGI